MQLYVSRRGQVTADTLCEFDKVLVPEDAFVEESATVSNYQFNFTATLRKFTIVKHSFRKLGPSSVLISFAMINLRGVSTLILN